MLLKFICKIESSAPTFFESNVEIKLNADIANEIDAAICSPKSPPTVKDAQTPTNIPKVENFKIMQARITDPHQLDSTCASGNQKEKGTLGTFSQMINANNHEAIFK